MPLMLQEKKGSFFSLVKLLLVSMIFSLCLGELLVRMFSPQQLIMNLKIWNPEPGIGWRHKPSLNTKVNMGERATHFVTDANGYRINRQPNQAGKPDLSILMIGDSFLEALGVENEESIPELIREKLQRKYEVNVRAVNAGVGAWQPGQYLLEARRALLGNRYDLGVIFFYVENDCLEELVLKFDPQQVTPSTQLKFPSRLSWQEFRKNIFYPINNYLEQRSHLFVFLKDRFQILLAKIGLTPYYFPEIFYKKEANSFKWEVTASAAQLIQQEFEKFNAPVLFVLLPADYQVYPDLLAKYSKMFQMDLNAIEMDQPNRLLTAKFREKSLQVVDMLTVFRQNAQKGRQLYGRIDNHMNPQGHAVTAEAIFPYVEQVLKSKLQIETAS